MKEGEKNGVKKRVENRLRGIERKMERWKKKRRVWKVSLNIPSYTVELRGTERRGALELAQGSVKHRCKPV